MNKKKTTTGHPIRDNLEVFAFAIAMALGLKVYALEVYQIPTGSMQPMLMGTDLQDPQTRAPAGGLHDRVLVDKLSYLLREPERWEVIVFRYPLLSSTNYVKRMVGMPGEEIWIRHGDVWAREHADEDFAILRKPLSLQKELWRKVHPLVADADQPWRIWRRSGNWMYEEDGSVLVVADGGSARFARTIKDNYRDGYPDKIREQIPIGGGGYSGSNIVSDLRFTCALETTTDSESFRLQLKAGPHSIRVVVPGPAGDGLLRLEGDEGELSTLEFVGATGPIQLEVAFWDHTVLVTAEAENGVEAMAIHPLTLNPAPASSNGVSLVGMGGPWRVSDAQIDRDIHYTESFGSSLYSIPEDSYFMLGDNTQNSLDSRGWQVRQLAFSEPFHGLRGAAGDNHLADPNPGAINPRWTADRSTMVLRDAFGDVHFIPREIIVEGTGDLAEAAPFVPRDYILGKALCVFLPIPPLSPVWRVTSVR